MTTTPLTVYGALVALAASTFGADPDPVQIVDGPLVAEAARGERLIRFGDIVGTGDPDALDYGTALEQYVVLVELSVDLAGAGDETVGVARAAVLGLWDRWEAAVRDEGGPARLGMTEAAADAAGLLAARPSRDFEVKHSATKRGREALVRCGVMVTAQRT